MTHIHRSWVGFSGFDYKIIPLAKFKKQCEGIHKPHELMLPISTPSEAMHETNLLRDWVQDVLTEKAVHRQKQKEEKYMERNQANTRNKK